MEADPSQLTVFMRKMSNRAQLSTPGEMETGPRRPSGLEEPQGQNREESLMPDSDADDADSDADDACLRVLRPHEGAALLARAQGLSAALMGFTASQLHRLAETAAFVELDQDAHVMMQGEVSSFVVIVLSGSLIIRSDCRVTDENIRNSKDGGVVLQGHLVGEFSLFEGGKRTANVLSREPRTALMLLEYDAINKLAESEQEGHRLLGLSFIDQMLKSSLSRLQNQLDVAVSVERLNFTPVLAEQLEFMIAEANQDCDRATADFTPTELRTLSKRVALASFEAGQTVFALGNVSDHIAFVLEGEFDIQHGKLASAGRRGHWLGSVAFTTGLKRPGSVIARCPSKLAVLNRQDLLRLLRAEPVLYRKLQRVLALHSFSELRGFLREAIEARRAQAVVGKVQVQAQLRKQASTRQLVPVSASLSRASDTAPVAAPMGIRAQRDRRDSNSELLIHRVHISKRSSAKKQGHHHISEEEGMDNGESEVEIIAHLKAMLAEERSARAEVTEKAHRLERQLKQVESSATCPNHHDCNHSYMIAGRVQGECIWGGRAQAGLRPSRAAR
jgi:CRP-like cAMP-binding protein